MVMAIYAVLLLICSFTLRIFGFIVGRCARKIPILDNNLPRALYRGQMPSEDSQAAKESAKSAKDTTCRPPSSRKR
jgi:hypothetical protein